MKILSNNISLLIAAFALSTSHSAAIAALPSAGDTISAEEAAQQQAYVDTIVAISEEIEKQTGDVKVPEANVTLSLKEDYYFLDADDARRVLVDAWGNPPQSVTNVLGMVFPADRSFADDGWGAVLSFENSGYVSDEDARDIDYQSLMESMKEQEGPANERRAELGYPSQRMNGWAENPSYDSKLHKLIWATDFKVGNADVNTLNYDVRLLGRYGVLSVNMVSSMSELEEVHNAATLLGSAIAFDDGSRYSDFNAATDKVADYGVAGLLAAGVGAAALKKTGLLAGLLIFLKKAFIPIIIGIGAIFTFLRNRLFGRKEEEYEEEYYDSE